MKREDTENERPADDGKVVYRRTGASGESKQAEGGERPSGRVVPRGLAPTLWPLVVGFALLLLLVFLLGYLSVRQLDAIRSGVSDLQNQQAAKVGTLLELRFALTKLDNEARARARYTEQEAQDAITFSPPFALRLRNARADVEKLLPQFDALPAARTERGAAFRRDLTDFFAATDDPRLYSLEGFGKFGNVDAELNSLLRDATGAEQIEVQRRSRELQDEATRKLRALWLSALGLGLAVAAGSVWEAQRRFRQLRRSMEEARREREYSAQMLEGMVSAVAAVDARGRIRSANHAFYEIFPRASVGASVHEDFAASEAQRMLEAAVATQGAEGPYRGRFVCEADSPECAGRTFDVYSSPLTIDGESGRIVTLVDVTEAAEAEGELRRTESLRAVGQAAAQVAHEIRNPLGSIRLGVSMLRDTATAPDALNTINLVERGINHLNKLVVDVTQFSRQKRLERSDVDVHGLLDTSLELVADKLRESKTRIEKRYAADQMSGRWDDDQLRQVFVNLLANAADASEEGASVSVSTEKVVRPKPAGDGNGGASPQASAFARVTIADRGRGMDEQTRARIFEPFFTTKKRGTGLGLAISKQIVEQHGGAITVDSAPGEGTRFVVDLPL